MLKENKNKLQAADKRCLQFFFSAIVLSGSSAFFGLFTFYEKNDKINNETLYSNSVAEGVVR